MADSGIVETLSPRASMIAHGQRILAAKGFSAVGINEILTAAGVPKGSFYHYFGSKDAYGEALLEDYFEGYLADLETTFTLPGLNMAQRLMCYWRELEEIQSFGGCQGKCLTVKLGAEVADLSEPMRIAMKNGASRVISRLAEAIEAAVAEGSLTIDDTPDEAAQSLYQLWLGASVLAKVVRNQQPFATALRTTLGILHLK